MVAVTFAAEASPATVAGTDVVGDGLIHCRGSWVFGVSFLQVRVEQDFRLTG